VTCLEHPSPFAVSARSAQQDKKILCQKPKWKKNYNSSSSSGRQSFTIDGYLHQTRLKDEKRIGAFRNRKKNTNKQIPYISARRRNE
jgi:hypothetical protein